MIFGSLRYIACLLAFSLSACGIDSYSQKNSADIADRFVRARTAVISFRKEQGRLPSSDELNKLLGTTGDAYSLWISTQGLTDCDTDLPEFQHVRAGSYILAIWRGQWLECYDPETGKSSL